MTAEAGKLQADNAIRYYRGRITVLDRAKLEVGSCACYAVVKKEYDWLNQGHITDVVGCRMDESGRADQLSKLPLYCLGFDPFQRELST